MEFSIDMHIIFIDYKQAYDQLNRNKAMEDLKNNQIPKKMRNIIEMTWTGSSAVTNKRGNARQTKSKERDETE